MIRSPRTSSTMRLDRRSEMDSIVPAQEVSHSEVTCSQKEAGSPGHDPPASIEVGMEFANRVRKARQYAVTVPATPRESGADLDSADIRHVGSVPRLETENIGDELTPPLPARSSSLRR